MDRTFRPPLFVYGTLMDEDLRALVLGHSQAGIAAMARGLRVVFFPGEVYPAVMDAPGAQAQGLLLEHLDGADIARLDAYEGHEYERVRIAVSCRGASVEAEIYRALIALDPESRDWSLARWQREHKAKALIDLRLQF